MPNGTLSPDLVQSLRATLGLGTSSLLTGLGIGAILGAFITGGMNIVRDYVVEGRSRRAMQTGLRAEVRLGIAIVNDLIEKLEAGPLADDEIGRLVTFIPWWFFESRSMEVGLLDETQANSVTKYYALLWSRRNLSKEEVVQYLTKTRLRQIERAAKEALDALGDRGHVDQVELEEEQVPLSPEDREYLVMMCQDNGEYRRHHEALRSAADGFFIALIAGLLAFAATTSKSQSLALWGLAVCVTSVLGAILNYKHYERTEFHVNRMRGFRGALESGISQLYTKINSERDKEHIKRYGQVKQLDIYGLKLHTLSLLVYVITFLLGLVLIANKYTLN
jgi:hypothetical protein